MFVLNASLDALNANLLTLPHANPAYLEHIPVLADHAFSAQLVAVPALQILYAQPVKKVMILQTVFALQLAHSPVLHAILIINV